MRRWCDLLLLDEVQDLQPEWVDSMLTRLRPNGRAVLMEDPDQQLYADRVPFDVPDAVTVTSNENFRSPRAIVRLINGLRLTRSEVEAKSPHEGDMPDPIIYDSPEAIARSTSEAVECCLRRGFGVDDIAVVSMRGRDRSVLQQLDRLGPWTLRRFTGRWDDGGAPPLSCGFSLGTRSLFVATEMETADTRPTRAARDFDCASPHSPLDVSPDLGGVSALDADCQQIIHRHRSELAHAHDASLFQLADCSDTCRLTVVVCVQVLQTSKQRDPTPAIRPSHQVCVATIAALPKKPAPPAFAERLPKAAAFARRSPSFLRKTDSAIAARLSE
jgi:hypothetical protein